MKITRSSKIQSFALATALSISVGFVPPAFAERYLSYIVDLNSKQVTQLGGLGMGHTRAYAINDAGQIAGTSMNGAGATHGFITGPNGIGMTDLGMWDVTGINAAGQAVGYSNYPQRAVVTGPNGVGMTYFVPLGGVYSAAYGINNAGQIVGYSTTAASIASHAFITGPNGMGSTDLGTLGGRYSWAHGVNASGQAVGWSSTAGDFNTHAFIAGPNGVGMTDLGVLGRNNSVATGINASGQAVGWSETTLVSQGYHAFITGPNGVGMTDLGTLGGSYAQADGINDAGQVVGRSTVAAGVYHAFITGPNGVGMIDLNSLVSLPGVILTEATAINNHGQLVVMSSVVPEPETYALLLAGLSLIGFMTRRHKAGAEQV